MCNPHWRWPWQISDSVIMASLDDLPDDVESLKALILTARVETQAARAAVETIRTGNIKLAALTARHDQLAGDNAVLSAEVARLTAQNERLDHYIKVMRRGRFGRSSERLSDEQMNLALDDIHITLGMEDAVAEKAQSLVKHNATAARRANRGHLPEHLPREVIVIEPEAKC